MTNAASPPSPFPRDRLEARMERDPLLRSVVDALTMLILKLEMTPTEVRETAIYACVQAEMRRMPSRFAVPVGTIQEARQRLDEMQSHLDAFVPGRGPPPYPKPPR